MEMPASDATWEKLLVATNSRDILCKKAREVKPENMVRVTAEQFQDKAFLKGGFFLVGIWEEGYFPVFPTKIWKRKIDALVVDMSSGSYVPSITSYTLADIKSGAQKLWALKRSYMPSIKVAGGRRKRSAKKKK